MTPASPKMIVPRIAFIFQTEKNIAFPMVFSSFSLDHKALQ